MKEYSTILFYGRVALLTEHQTANFAGTCMALVGILRNGETVDQWRKRCDEKRKQSFMDTSNWEIQQIKHKTVR